MRKKYLSALLFGALLVTSAGTFTSCKDYDDDIKNLQEQIDVIKTDLASLTETVNNLDGVKDMSFTDGKLVIETGNGKKVEVDIPSATGITKVELKDNVLYVNDEPQGEVVIPEDELVKVEVKEDGKLYINDEVQDLEIGSKVVMVDNGDYYTMTIDGKESYNLPKYNAANELNYVTIEEGLTFGQITGTSATAFTWGYSDNEIEWNGSKIAAKTLLVGTIGTAEVSVSPNNFDLGAQKLELVNTEGKAADVNVFATPAVEIEDGKPATGSRAASANGKWNLSIEMKDNVTPDNIGSAFKTTDGYILYALSVNGKLVTAYDIAIKAADTKTETNVTYAASELTLGETNFNSNPTLAIGENKLVYTHADGNVVDSYITFEGAQKDLADSYEISANGMTITAGSKAGAKSVTATIHLLGVNGKEVTATQELTFASSEVEAGKVSAEDLKVSAEATTYILINVEDFFTSADLEHMDDSSEGINGDNATDGLSFTIEDENEVPLFGGTSNYFSYQAYKDKECKEVFNKTNDAVADLKYIRLAKSKNYNDEAKEGTYTITMTLKDDNGNEVKKATADLKVVLPEWDDIFIKRQSEWNAEGTVVNVLTTSYKTIDMSNGGTYFAISDDYSEVNADLTLSLVNPTSGKTSVSEGVITLKDDVLSKDGEILKDIPAQYEYSFGGELKINSGTFNIHPYSRVDDFELKYYVENAAKDVIEVEYDSSLGDSKGGVTIAAFTHKENDATKDRSGLALVKDDKEYAFGGTTNASTTINDLNLASASVSTAEILTTGYSDVTCSFTDGALTLTNKSDSDDQIITNPTSSYDIKVRVKVTDGAIVNYVDLTIRIKNNPS